MPGPESAMNCPSGKKAQMYVDGDASIEQRRRVRRGSVGLGFVGEPEASKSEPGARGNHEPSNRRQRIACGSV